jgi:hypothetical protein
MSLWLPCGLHGFAVPNTVTVTVILGKKFLHVDAWAIVSVVSQHTKVA